MTTTVVLAALIGAGNMSGLPIYAAGGYGSEMLVLEGEVRSLHSNGTLRRYYIGSDFYVHETRADFVVSQLATGRFVLLLSNGRRCEGYFVRSEPPGGLRLRCSGWPRDQLMMRTSHERLELDIKAMHKEAGRQRSGL